MTDMINFRSSGSWFTKDLYHVKSIIPRPSIPQAPRIARKSQQPQLASIDATKPRLPVPMSRMLLDLNKHNCIHLSVISNEVNLQAAIPWTGTRITFNNLPPRKPKIFRCAILTPCSMVNANISRFMPLE